MGAVFGHYLLTYLFPLNLLPDKLFHFTAYLVLGVLCGQAFGNSAPLWRYGALVLLTAACDESLQLLVPARSASITDLLADAAGAYCGWALWQKVFKHAD